MYDSTHDTLNHIARVQKHMNVAINELLWRRDHHDASKLREPDKSNIDSVRERLLALDFGSVEYRALKKQYFASHYAQNDHHIEYYPNGVWGMNLFTIMEMACDWLAAVETHKDGDNVFDSLTIISEEYNFPEYLTMLLYNTFIYLGCENE